MQSVFFKDNKKRTRVIKPLGKISKYAVLGENNGRWKGKNVSIDAVHEYIRRRLPMPKACQKCHKQKPLDLANKSGHYLRDVADWSWLCRKCHMTVDKRIENLKQYSG